MPQGEDLSRQIRKLDLLQKQLRLKGQKLSAWPADGERGEEQELQNEVYGLAEEFVHAHLLPFVKVATKKGECEAANEVLLKALEVVEGSNPIFFLVWRDERARVLAEHKIAFALAKTASEMKDAAGMRKWTERVGESDKQLRMLKGEDMVVTRRKKKKKKQRPQQAAQAPQEATPVGVEPSSLMSSEEESEPPSKSDEEKVALPPVGNDHRNSVAPMSAEDLAEEIEKSVQLFTSLKTQAMELGMIGSPDDEDLRKLDETKKEMVACQRNTTCLVKDLGTQQLSETATEQLSEMIINAVTSGDENCEFVAAALANWEQSCADLLNREGLLSITCADGHPGLLAALLDYSIEAKSRFPGGAEVEVDSDELIPLACFNQTHRIPLVKVLLNHKRMDWAAEGLWDTVAESIQTFVDSVCTSTNNGEVTTGRCEVLKQIFTHPNLKAEGDGKDGMGQSLFARAVCRDDVEIMDCLYTHHKSSINVNEALSDGTTLLMRAIFKEALGAIKWLVDNEQVDLEARGANGTAIEMAEAKEMVDVINILNDRLL